LRNRDDVDDDVHDGPSPPNDEPAALPPPHPSPACFLRGARGGGRGKRGFGGSRYRRGDGASDSDLAAGPFEQSVFVVAMSPRPRLSLSRPASSVFVSTVAPSSFSRFVAIVPVPTLAVDGTFEGGRFGDDDGGFGIGDGKGEFGYGDGRFGDGDVCGSGSGCANGGRAEEEEESPVTGSTAAGGGPPNGSPAFRTAPASPWEFASSGLTSAVPIPRSSPIPMPIPFADPVAAAKKSVASVAGAAGPGGGGAEKAPPPVVVSSIGATTSARRPLQRAMLPANLAGERPLPK